jgi:DNA-binding response OmpR family regulator
VDLSTCTAVVGGVDVPLTVAEAEVLHGLLERPGAVVPRQDLTWSTRVGRLDKNLDAVVRQVRAKLEAVEGFRRIVAVRGLGFRFLPDGEVSADRVSVDDAV